MNYIFCYGPEIFCYVPETSYRNMLPKRCDLKKVEKNAVTRKHMRRRPRMKTRCFISASWWHYIQLSLKNLKIRSNISRFSIRNHT
jgi:hypothetical protein